MRNPDATIVGIDFSGASKPASSIWISEATQRGENLEVLEAYPAAKLPSLSKTSTRSTVYEGIRDLVQSGHVELVGIDFPFGLPKSIIGQKNQWELHLSSELFEAESADMFREKCVDAIREAQPDASRSYLRRETDIRYAAQCPYAHQIQYQTFYGNRKILRPLLEKPGIAVQPMQEPDSGHTILVEVYPAATLGRLRTYRHGYKGSGVDERRRRQILNDIDGPAYQIRRNLDTETIIGSHDALDSILAAIGAHHAKENGFWCNQEESKIEGQIFA